MSSGCISPGRNRTRGGANWEGFEVGRCCWSKRKTDSPSGLDETKVQGMLCSR